MRQLSLHKFPFLFLCFFASFSCSVIAQEPSPCTDLAILNLPNSVCKNAPNLALVGSPAGGFFTIDDDTTSVISLNSSILSIGNHTVIYHFTVENVCSNTATQTVEVKGIPGAPFSVHFFDCYNTMPKAHAVGYGFDKIYEWNSKADRTGTLIPSKLIIDNGISIGYTSIVETGVMNTGTTVLDTFYYVFEVGANGCYSDATEVPITVFPTPKTQPEILSPTFGCGNSITISANGHGNIVEWRTNPISIFGQTLAKGDAYTTTNSETLYAMEVAEFLFTPTQPLPVSETTLRCYGGPTPLINIILVPTPNAPVLEDFNLCVGDTSRAIYKNENFVWYASATGGIKTSEPAIIETNTPSFSTYYVAQIIDFCESTERTALNVTVHAIPTTPSVSVENPSCSVSTGTIAVSQTEGFQYSFDNGASFQSANIQSGLASGIYKIMVKNEENCVSIPTSAVINAPLSVPATPSVSVTNPTCSVSTGTLTVLPTAGFEYSFDNGASFQLSNVKSELTSGSYQIMVKTGENCVSMPTTAVINAPLSIPTTPSVSVINPTCTLPTGTLTVSPTAGFTYSFDNGISFQSSNVKSGLVAETYFIKVKNSDGCISSETKKVVDYPKFAFNPNKCYKIVNKNSGKVLDVFEGKTANATPIIQYNSTNGSNQKWQFSALPEGYVQIKAQHSNKFLTCFSNNNGANTFQYEYITGSHKEWKIECLTNGEYRIFHRFSGKFLSVQNNTSANKARIEIRNWANNNAQKWLIAEVSCAETAKVRQADLLSAKAEGAVNNVQIAWYSNLGEKTDYYTIEKLDALTEEFRGLKTLNNIHFDNEMRTFSVSDAAPSEGENVYRIKAVFNDGTHQLSENLKVTFGDIKTVRLFPNPTTDFIDVQLPEMPVGEVVLTLNNMFGKPVAHKKYEAAQTLHFETGELPNGVYQLNIVRKGKRSMVKQIIIQK
jgi:hypothetical protein